jgi:hypothetical protein
MTRLPTIKKERNDIVLAIQRAIIATFGRSEWKELAYRTGAEEEITAHYRLLRSLDWNDPDYPANVLWGIETILEADKDGLEEMLTTPKIIEWLRDNEPAVYAAFGPEAKPIAVPTLTPRVTSATVDRAIRDAETLLKTSGAVSAVDRVHTVLHGYLLALCDEAGIAYGFEPGVTDLFKLLRKGHTKMHATGPRSQEVTQIIRSLASVVDALNPLRNKASVAHPNTTLLCEPEAMLVINAVRTLVHYLNDRLD